MRILYLAFADLAVPRAWTVHVLGICRHLHAMGHQVTLVTPRPSAEVPDEAFRWIRLPLPWRRMRALVEFQARLWHGLPGWIRESSIDAVYARVVPFAPWIAARVQSTGAAIVAEVNGVLEDELSAEGSSAARARIYRYTERLLLEGCDGVVAVTPAIGRRIRELCPRIRDLEVILNGVDPERFDCVSRAEAIRTLGLPAGPWIGFVGAFYRSRALEALVAAMPHVRRSVPQARLLLVGDGPERPAVEAAVRAVGPEVVHLLGEVPPERVPVAVAATDVCIFLCTLPRAETAVKLFEYMAGRRPVVTSWTAGVGEWMEREGTGVGVDAFSPPSIAEGILRILGRPEEAVDMGERGRALVESRHTWREAARLTFAFLERLVERRRRNDRT